MRTPPRFPIPARDQRTLRRPAQPGMTSPTVGFAASQAMNSKRSSSRQIDSACRLNMSVSMIVCIGRIIRHCRILHKVCTRSTAAKKCLPAYACAVRPQAVRFCPSLAHQRYRIGVLAGSEDTKAAVAAFLCPACGCPFMGGPYVGIFGCAGVQLAGTPTHTVPPTLIGVRGRSWHLLVDTPT